MLSPPPVPLKSSHIPSPSNFMNFSLFQNKLTNPQKSENKNQKQPRSTWQKTVHVSLNGGERRHVFLAGAQRQALWKSARPFLEKLGINLPLPLLHTHLKHSLSSYRDSCSPMFGDVWLVAILLTTWYSGPIAEDTFMSLNIGGEIKPLPT